MRTPRSLDLALLLGELCAHPGRAIVSILAVAIGVAMGYGVHLVNHAALAEFSQAVRSLMGNADLEIRGPRMGFDESLYPRIAGLPEVAAVSPVVEVDVAVPGRTGALKLFGIDAFRAAPVAPNLIGRPAAERVGKLDILDPDALFLSPAALSWLDLKPGDPLTVQVGLTALTLRIAGTLPAAGAGLRLGVMDIGAAQWRLGRLGLLQRIDVKLRPGVDTDNFAQALSALLPPGVVAGSPQDNVRRTSNLSRAYRVNLNVLALVALFTGAFLVFTMQAVSVLRRRSQFALLRALGVTRAGLLRLLLAEGVAQGTLGAMLGLALGFALAAAVLGYAGGDLGGGYFEGVKPKVRFDALAALIFFALGLSAAVLGSLAPAWEAARARPAQALKAGDEETPLKRLRSPWIGLAAMAAGLGLTPLRPVADLPVFGYAAIALLLVGAILLMPRLAHLVFGLLPSSRRAVPQLALTQLAGAPGRASIALAGIVASFSLMAAMAIMVSSFRISVDDWLHNVLPADLYLRASSSGDSAYFSLDDQAAIASVHGVARTEFLRSSQILLDPRRPPVTVIARPIDPRNPGARLPLTAAPVAAQPGDPPAVWVSEAMVDLYGFRPGQRITLPLQGRPVAFLVGGVWRDYARQYGTVVISQDDYRRLTDERRVTDVALWLVQGTGAAQVKERLRQRVAGGEHITFAEPGEIRTITLKIFDRSFAVTYLLEGIAVVIGLFGIGASFSAQALARAREFGMLRHLGFLRWQVGAMLALEGALLALLGVVAGLALGWVIAVILVHVVNPQSFHWTMNLHVPWAFLAQVASAVVAAASLAALASGRQAMSRSAVRAVQEDW
ncbi:ABC transporter permease [Cupriavidus necator]|uniref:ABC transporter permease n=1 Tax=Cupriavidus necator TaxID=106590 RepID=A0A367PF08_CUPNE|nr:ABC transporter permease [Cupriavidus necator]QQX88454.1 ABC transporter permease [Cupriavidus necator]RCJ06460.1 ABC transporter permease [Cupriavidus necator]